MGDGNMNQYFKYAFGELLLVILGILIALQINNWNEDRKEKIFERKMLNELLISLEADIKTLSSVYDIVDECNNSNQILIKASRSRTPLNDTMLVHFNNASCEYFFIYNKGPFEAIQSSGIDRISSDSIRNSIVEVYGKRLPQTYLFMNNIASELIWQGKELYKQFFVTRLVEDPSEMRAKRYHPIDPNLIIDENLHELLYQNQAIIYNYMSRVGGRIQNMKDLAAQLKAYLQ